MPLPSCDLISQKFVEYKWECYHNTFGYLADTFENGFPWIVELEKTFSVNLHNVNSYNALVRQLILWGGNVNDPLKRYSLGLSNNNISLDVIFKDILTNINTPKNALENAMRIPGLGHSYSTKLLRFIDPNNYGALDSRIHSKLHEYGVLKKTPSINNYSVFINLLKNYKNQLQRQNIVRPGYDKNPASVT